MGADRPDPGDAEHEPAGDDATGVHRAGGAPGPEGDGDDGHGEDEQALEWDAHGTWWQPELDELYDADTLAAIESWARGRVAAPDRVSPAPTDVPLDPAGRRDVRSLGAGAAMLAAGMFGLADALEPHRARPEVVEHQPEEAGDDEAVTYLHVPGDPRASRIIIRPWLL